MPRKARVKSATGVYHVMLRGINRQRIFEEGGDYVRFIQGLKRYREECGYELYAYCLMPNHIHLLIREGHMPLSRVFRKIGASFVYWYNKKHERVGHLFQDRFKSEVVEDEAYLLTVTRYIHMNPVKAGICDKPDDYKYSSYNDYTKGRGITDTYLIMGIMDRNDFRKYHQKRDSGNCLDIDESTQTGMTDEQVEAFIKCDLDIEEPQMIRFLDDKSRKRIIKKLRKGGSSIRQINRMTGIPIREVRSITA